MTIASEQVFVIPNTTLYHFGILNSIMHMVFMRAVCGRIKADYRYSNQLIYNNFPWPDATEAQQQTITELAQRVLDARAEFPKATLADLYDPLAMPLPLLKAHQALDKAIDKLYRAAPFADDRTRVEFLFDRYQQLDVPLAVKPKTRKKLN